VVYIMVLDAGASQIKAALFDNAGNMTALSERKVDSCFPGSGYVEQYPMQIYHASIEAIQETMHKAAISPSQVIALGITNQRNNVLLWDSKTGKPIHNAISWQDQRGPELTPGLMARHRVEFTIASLVAGKILWLFEEIPNLRSRVETKEVLFGGIDTWLLWKYTNGKVHATDVSNASTTFLYDLERKDWNADILSEVGIPQHVFPQVMDSSHIFGYVSTPDLKLTCPISAVVADQQASLFGHRCFNPGETKVTFGTGSFVLANDGNGARFSKSGIVRHIAWSFNGTRTYALEGSILTSGSALEWLVEGLGLAHSVDELESLATSVDDNAGVSFVPALAGLGSPSWDTKARGLLIGLNRGVRKGHIARAALEALAFQVCEVMEVMAPILSDTQQLRVDGRPAMNGFLIQTLADVCGLPVERAVDYHVTLRGAAYLAGLSTGVWSSLKEISNLYVKYETFLPHSDRRNDYAKWQEAVKRSYSWLT